MPRTATQRTTVSIHRINDTFYGYRKMIGGYTFVFGRSFGIFEETKEQQNKAEKIALSLLNSYRQLQLQGISDWTTETKFEAINTARKVIGFNPLTTVPIPQVKTFKKFDDAFDFYIKHKRQQVSQGQMSDKTVGTDITRIGYLKQIVLTDGTKILPDNLDSYDQKVIETLVAAIKESKFAVKVNKFSYDTIKDYLRTLKTMFRFFLNTNRWNGFPNWEFQFSFKKPKQQEKVKTTFTIDDLQCYYYFATDRMRLYMLLALNCGYTQMDLATFKWEHIDFDNRLIKRFRNKTGADSRHYLWQKTFELLQQHRTKYPPIFDDLVFYTQQKKPIVTMDISNNVRSSRCDTVGQMFQKLKQSPRMLKHVQPNTKLHFKDLRKTGSNFVLNHSNMEIANLYRAEQSTTVGEIHYFNKRFELLFEALKKVEVDIQKMFQPLPFRRREESGRRRKKTVV